MIYIAHTVSVFKSPLISTQMKGWIHSQFLK